MDILFKQKEKAFPHSTAHNLSLLRFFQIQHCSLGLLLMFFLGCIVLPIHADDLELANDNLKEITSQNAILNQNSVNETHTHGHGALEVFDDQGVKNSPKWVRIWVVILGLSFVVGIFFVKNHMIARWLVGGFLLNMLFSMIIVKGFQIPPISGLLAINHLIFWMPGFIMLLKQRPFMAKPSFFSVWSGVITCVIIFSYIFDIRDTAILLYAIFNDDFSL